MNHYLVILFGAILGMLLLIAVKSVYIQQSRKYELGFIAAFKVYTTKYTGPIAVGFIVVFIAMFIFPNIVAGVSDGKYAVWFEKALKYLRIYSVGLGFLSQGLGFIIIRKGEKFLRDEESKIKDSIENQLP